MSSGQDARQRVISLVDEDCEELEWLHYEIDPPRRQNERRVAPASPATRRRPAATLAHACDAHRLVVVTR